MTNIKKEKYIILMDNQVVEKEFVEKYNLDDLCTKNRKNWKINFVGLISQSSITIVSFPKHYPLDNIKYSLKKNIRILLNTFAVYRKNLYSYDSIGNETGLHFPYNAYTYIADYYNKYGLYVEVEKINSRGFKGKVNWKKTLRSSPKVVNNNKLLFVPFFVSKNTHIENFITECMKFVLYDGYNRVGVYFEDILNYPKVNFKISIGNYQKTIEELYQIKGLYFKDSTLKLIDALIAYFKWASTLEKSTMLVTTQFSDIWEVAVNQYLSKNFKEISSDGLNIIFEENINKISFKSLEEHVESPVTLKRSINKTPKFKVKYDHLAENNGIVYLFDSKYTSDFKELNYKQLSYHQFLSKRYNKDTSMFIYNGLIIPTEKEYHSKIHLDRRDIDDVFVMEHYLNIKDVLISYTKTS